MNTHQSRTKKFYARSMLHVLLVVLMLSLAACGSDDSGNGDKNDQSKDMFTVGVLSPAAVFDPMIEGFKAGMVDYGYVEGENVTYVANDQSQNMDTEIDAMLAAHEFDLFLVGGTPATTLAKAKLADTNIPIVFAPVNDPIASGLVDSLSNPGGNLTGIRGVDTTSKILEWLQKIIPDAQRVYVPHNPADNSSVQSVTVMQEAADKLNIELVIVEATTPEALDALSTSFPEDVDAVFLPRAGELTNRVGAFVQTANAAHIPVMYAEIGQIVEDGVMISYGGSFPEMGRQASRLADLILRGSNAGDLPVEVPEAFLAINLQTAETIGVEIDDSIVRQAYQIVRP